MRLSTYHAALEHRDRIDQELVMPGVGRKTGKQRGTRASAERSTS